MNADGLCDRLWKRKFLKYPHAVAATASPSKSLEPARRQRRVTGRILDIAVPQVRLEGSRIDPVVGQFEAARVPQHVGVRLDPELGASRV